MDTTLDITAPEDRLYPLSDLPRRTWMPRRDGKLVSPRTVRNWYLTGLGKVRLRTTKVGQVVCTCDRWAREFFDRGNGTPGVKPLSPTQRARKQRRTVEQLEAAGI